MSILKTLRQWKDRLFPSQDQKEITETIKTMQLQYSSLEHNDLITDLQKLFKGKKPSISVEADVVSTEAVRLADLFTLTFVDRERFQLEELIKGAYISRHLSEHALIPSEEIKSVKEGEETRYYIVYNGQEITIDERNLVKDGKGKLSLKVEEYRKVVTEKVLGEKLATSQKEKAKIVDFRKMLVEAAEKDPENKAVILALLNDQLDKNGIANGFGGPQLEAYAKFADIPVSVLALHSVLSAIKLTPIKFTKHGELNAGWVKRAFKAAHQTGDPKLVTFLEELTGKTISETGGVVSLEGRRKGKFEVLLPVVAEVIPHVQQAVNIGSMFTDEQHQQAIVALTAQCDGYVAAAVASGSVGSDVSAELNRQADQFVAGIRQENERSGRYDYLTTWFNKQQAQVFTSAYSSFVGELQKSIDSQAGNTVVTKFKAVQEQVKTGVESLGGIDDKTRTAFSRPMSSLVVRPVDIQSTYTSDMAVISGNVALIQRIQDRATHEISRRVLEYQRNNPTASKDDITKFRKKVSEEIKVSTQAEISKILAFTATTLDGVGKKEELRTFEVVLGQIKYEGLSTAATVFEERKKQIEADLEKELNGDPKSKTDKGLNGQIAAKKVEIEKLKADKNSLVLARGKTVQEQYAEQFEKDIKDWFSELKATAGGTMLPDTEIKKLIKQAREAIGKKAFLTKGKTPTLTTEQLQAEYSTQFQKIVIMNTRYQHKGKPKAEVDKLVEAAVAAATANGVVAEDGTVTGVGVIRGNLTTLDMSLGLVPPNAATNPEMVKVDEQIEQVDLKIKKAEEDEIALREQVEQKKREAQERIRKEEKALRLAEARIRSVELATTAAMLAERIAYFEGEQADLGTEIDLAKLGFELDPETKKLYENYLKDRAKYAEEIGRVLEEAKTKRAKLFAVAEEEYDFIMEEVNGVITPKFFDNPTRIANDINPVVPETYRHMTRIDAINAIMTANPADRKGAVDEFIKNGVLLESEIGDGLTDSVLSALLESETAAVKPVIETYKGMKPEEKLAFQRDYVRYTHFTEKKYIYIDPTKDVQPQLDSAILDTELTGVATAFDRVGATADPVVVEEEVHTEDPVVTTTTTTTTTTPKQPSEEIVEFVDNYLTQQTLMSIINNPSLIINAQPGSQAAGLVEQGLFDASGNITEFGQEHIKTLRLDMYKLSKKLPKFGTDERRAFITDAATHYVAKVKAGQTIIPITEELSVPEVAVSMGTVLTAYENLGRQEEERGPQAVEAEVQEDQNITPMPYIKPTDKSIELALKEVSKTLKKLDEKIAQSKWENRQAELAELRRQNTGGNGSGTPVEEVVDTNATGGETANLQADAQLRQAYLSVVYGELFAKVGGMSAEETKALFTQLDKELDPETFAKYKRADGTVDTVAMIEGETGVKLPGQMRAITAQISTVKNGKNIGPDGVITNASGTRVEEKLYERFEAGNIEEVLSALSGTTSATKKKYIARNIVIHTLGQGLIEREIVAERAAQLGAILEEAGYQPPYDPQTLKDLTAGKLQSKTKEGEVVSIAKIKEPIQAQIQKNTKGKGTESGDSGMGGGH